MKRGFGIHDNLRVWLARLARLERATYGFEVRRSIQLSYRRGGLVSFLETIAKLRLPAELIVGLRPEVLEI